jgi:hypothetical protein
MHNWNLRRRKESGTDIIVEKIMAPKLPKFDENY